MTPFRGKIATIVAAMMIATPALAVQTLSVFPGPLCDIVEPLFSHGRYVPVSDMPNGPEILRIENGSKVSVCGTFSSWSHISFTGERDFTGWVRTEFVH